MYVFDLSMYLLDWEKKMLLFISCDCFICDSLKQGGHLYYLGAGSLGIMGLIDASECPPTYGASKLVVGGGSGGAAVFMVVDCPFSSTQKHVHVRAYTHTRTHARTHAHTHTHTHTHTHIYMHACATHILCFFLTV